MTSPVAFFAALVDDTIRRMVAGAELETAPCTSVHLDPDGGITIRLGDLRITPDGVRRLMGARS